MPWTTQPQGDHRYHRLVTDKTMRFDKGSLVGFVTLLAVAVLSLVGRLVVAHNQGNSWIDVVSVLGLIVVGVLLFILLLLGLFDWRNRVRARALSATNPAAFIGQVVTDPTLVRQVDKFAVKLTGHPSKVRESSYVTLVADRASIRIFNGSRKPREAVSFPTSTLVRVSIGSSQSGARFIPCLDLFLDNGAASARVSVHLIRTRHGVPRFVKADQLDAALKAFQSATGKTG